MGDIIIFHCLTQHEANPHGVKDAAGAAAGGAAEVQLGGDPYRVSMDGRFMMELGW